MQSIATKLKTTTFKPISISLDQPMRKKVAARMKQLGLVSRSEYVRKLIREDAKKPKASK